MKRLVHNYTFDTGTKKIVLPDYSDIKLENLLLVTNVTRGVIMYNFAANTSGASASGNVIQLVTDTTGMDNADRIQIYYDDLAVDSREDENSDFAQALYEVTEKLGFLTSLRNATGQLRVDISNGGSVSLNANQTLATLSNMVAVGGFSANQHIPATQNTIAVQSNINNVVIT